MLLASFFCAFNHFTITTNKQSKKKEKKQPTQHSKMLAFAMCPMIWRDKIHSSEHKMNLKGNWYFEKKPPSVSDKWYKSILRIFLHLIGLFMYHLKNKSIFSGRLSITIKLSIIKVSNFIWSVQNFRIVSKVLINGLRYRLKLSNDL